MGSHLELMLGSPIQTTAGTGTAFSAKITANEDGIAKLSKLLCSLRGDAAVANATLGLWKIAQVTAITLNGADLYIRGSNSPGAPMSQFGPDRQGVIAGLPDVGMRSQDTLLVTGLYTYLGGVGDFSVGVPFTPKSKRSMSVGAPLRGPEVLAASPDTAVANNTEVDVSCTFDSAGIFDFSRMVIAASIPPTSNIHASDGAEYVNNVVIRQAILRSDYNNVIGGGTAPEFGAGYWNGNRQINWLELGRHRVSSGDVLKLTVYQLSGVTARVSFSVPQTVAAGGVPHAGPGSDKCGC